MAQNGSSWLPGRQGGHPPLQILLGELWPRLDHRELPKQSKRFLDTRTSDDGRVTTCNDFDWEVLNLLHMGAELALIQPRMPSGHEAATEELSVTERVLCE